MLEVVSVRGNSTVNEPSQAEAAKPSLPPDEPLGDSVLDSRSRPALMTLMASWYDSPQYYDLAFRSETRGEANFIEAACRKYCPFRARRLLEPACGSGRLMTELAARGHRMTGFDLNEPALAYLRRRMARRGLRAKTFVADMADFRVKRPMDAAYCTFDSFRHLLTESAARAHLECMARSLRRGGIYILGFHLLPPDAAEECIERWTERHGATQVTVTLRVVGTDRREDSPRDKDGPDDSEDQ